MVKSMSPVNDASIATSGKKENIRSSDFDGGSELREGHPIAVWSEQADPGHALAFGHGTTNRNDGNTEYGYADFQQDDGSGAPEPMEGDLYVEVRGVKNREVEARQKVDDLESLREDAPAQQADKTERYVNAMMDEWAGPHSHVTLAIDAAPASDGKSIMTSETNCRFVYTDIS